MICVYAPNCTDFSNNGLGAVSPQSCTVTETLNGEWELTLVHPIDELGKWQRLTEGCILRAPVPAAMTPQINLVTQQYQTTTYDVEIYKVSTSRDPLRLRSGTGTKYKILGKYKKGTEVIVIEKTSSSWYEVTCPDGKHGYMSSEYLTYVRTEQQSTTSHVGFANDVMEARQLRDQPFRIYRVVPELNKVTIYARHIFYDLLDNMLKSVKPASDAVGASVVKSISDRCLSEHDFTFYSDLESTAADVSFENINPVEALLGDDGLTGKYGAELARDWFDVFLVSRVGSNSDVQIREKKNLTGISFDVDETDVVTRIMPTGQDADGNLLYLPELYIDSPNIGAYAHPKWIHLAVSEAKEVTEGDDTKSKSECYTDMRNAVQAEYDAGCDLPTVTLKVDFINCKDTEEYKQYAALSDIFLGDSIRVIARRIGVEVTMRMTQYTYDCLTRKYTSVTLGTAAEALEGTTVAARQLASGSISGAKLMLNSIGSGHLQNGSVGSLQIKTAAIGAAHIQNAAISSAHIQDAAITSAKIDAASINSAHIQDAVIESGHIAEAAIGSAHIQNASITSAHIAAALVDVLNVNALNAVTARIRELAAGQITTDELYASIAMISTAQLTTANIINASIDWAQIESLAADIATISKAQITSANIDEANIDWAAITTLTAAVGTITQANIETADIDWSHIKDLATDTAIITQGTAGEIYIAKLAVTEANMVSLTVGELIVKGSDGHFYSVSVDDNGEVVTTLKQVSNDDVADLSINGGEKIIEGSITAGTLNVQNIFADNATIRRLIAANLDVDTLFAREATINAINAMDITSNTYLRLMVDKKADQTDVDAIEDRLSAAELKITEDAIVSTVTKSEAYTSDLAAVQSAADAAQKSIDDLSVGGRNLILRSATQDKAYGNAREGAEPVEGETYLSCNVFRTCKAWMDIGVNLTRIINEHGLITGDVVTYSIYNKSDDTVARRYSCFYSPPSTTTSGSKTLLTLDDRLNTEWTRLVCTFAITEDIMNIAKAGTAMPLRFECHTANTEGTFQYWAAPKLELGNIATDWTPAPEDLTDGINAAKTAADTAQSVADANAATISALATRVTTAEQKITADAIVSTVTQSETYANDLAAVQSAADAAQNSADEAQRSINDLSVGGRNLFENSADLTGSMFGQYSCPEKVYGEGEDTAVPSGKYISLTFSLDPNTVYQGGPYLFSKNTLTNVYSKLVDGETYTVSVWAKCSTEKTTGKLGVEFLTNKVSQCLPSLSSKWQRYVVTGVFDASLAYSAITFYYGAQWLDGDVFYLSSPQIEMGNIATDWTPAPEDAAAGIETAQSTADAVKSIADANTASISALATRVTTAEQKITADAIVSTVTKSETYTSDLAAVQTSANTAQSSADAAQTAADAAQSSIDSLNVGGRNLLLASNVLIMGSNATVVKDTESNGYILTSTTTDGWARAVTKQRLVVEAGAQYTMSARFKDASDGKVLGIHSLVNGWLYQNDEHYTNGYSGVFSLEGNRIIFTMTIDDLDGELTFQPWFYCNNQAGTNAVGNRITFYDIKFERGNRATDWTPAPEDVDVGIEKAQNAADAAQSVADSAQSTADANASSISALTTRMASAEQKITADAIVSTVTKSETYMSDLAGKASVSAVAAVQSAADKTQDAIDNLQIGGTNIICESGDFKTLSRWKINAASDTSLCEVAECDGYNCLHAVGSVAQTGSIYRLEWDTEYVLHCMGKFAAEGTLLRNYAPLHYWIYQSNDLGLISASNSAHTVAALALDGIVVGDNTTELTANQWHHIEFRFKTIAKPSTYEYVLFRPFFYSGAAATGCEYWIRWIKLEKGNRATAWSLAPEDVEIGIAAAQSAADSAQSTADANTSSLSALTTRVASTEQKITADAIVSTVRSSTTYKADIAAVQAAADAAQATADSIDVGGRNLLPNTQAFLPTSASGTLTGETYRSLAIRYLDCTTMTSGYKELAGWNNVVCPEYGEVYTLSFYAKGNSKMTTYFYGASGYVPVKVLAVSTDATYSTGYADGNCIFPLTDVWTRYWVTYQCASSGDTTVGKHVLFRLWYGNEAYVCGVKLEKGNRATDWSPAPEDAEEGIAAAQSSADAAQSTADANASSISALTTRMTSAEQKITADAIISTVRSSSAYTADLAGKASVSAVTAAQTAADAAQADIDSLQIGGCNLIAGSNRYRKDSPLSNTTSAKDGIITNQYLYMPCTPGETYTFQCKTDGIWGTHDTSGKGGGRTHLYLYLQTEDELGTYSSFKTPKDLVSTEYIGKTGLGVWTYTVPTTYAYERIRFRFDIHSDGSTAYTVNWWDLKAEKGNVATDWTPAPEDVDSDIAAAQTTANSAQSTASTNASNISALTTRMTSAESSITQNANQIALKVSASTYNTEKVYRSTTAPTTLYTNMLWLDLSLSPPILKRYTGSTWAAVGAQDVKNSGITITSNDISITTENFLLQLLDPSDNENVLMEMSADGNVGFKELYADEVISDSVAQAYFGPAAIYISPSYTGTSDTYFRSLGEAVKVLNNRYLKSDVNIYLPYGMETYEPSGVFIRGISGPGRLRIYGYADSSILNSYIQVKGCFAHIYFQNVHLRESRSMNGTSYQPYLVELQMNHYVEFYNCTLDANSVTYDSVYSKGSYVYLNSCGLYNALQGLEVFTGLAFMMNCCGSCNWSMVSYAGIITASGTVPAGSKGSGNNGQVYSSNTTVDYGTAISVVTPDETCILYATTTKSWRGSWRSDTVDVIQGVYYESGYSSSLNWNRGCMWFSGLQSILSGCTVKSATLTLHRKTGSGSSSAKTVYLCAITNTSASGTPSIAVNYGALGTIGRGKQVTFSIPVAAVQGLADGTYGGLCLYESPYNFGSSTYSNCYMRMSGTDTDLEPYLTVVYSGSTAVG